jgi:hypothetical protein
MKRRSSLLIAALVVLAGSAATAVQAASSTVVMSTSVPPRTLGARRGGVYSGLVPGGLGGPDLTVVHSRIAHSRQDQCSGCGAQPTALARATPSIHPTQPTGGLTP